MTSKRVIAVFLCCLCLIQPCCASANNMLREQAETKLHVLIATSGSTIDGHGKCSSLPGYTSTVYVYIQKNVDNVWVSVSSSSGATEATTSVVMEHGHTYRVYATCKVYDPEGILFDSDYAYSATVSY